MTLESGRPPASRLHTAIAANIGAVLEWFDLVIYALFAVVLGRQFFPATDPNVSRPAVPKVSFQSL